MSVHHGVIPWGKSVLKTELFLEFTFPEITSFPRVPEVMALLSFLCGFYGSFYTYPNNVQPVGMCSFFISRVTCKIRPLGSHLQLPLWCRYCAEVIVSLGLVCSWWRDTFSRSLGKRIDPLIFSSAEIDPHGAGVFILTSLYWSYEQFQPVQD